MGGINVGRVLAGGFVAAVLIWLIEGAASVLYMADMEAALAAHNLTMDLSARAVAISIAVSLIAGLTLVFLYAAARPRFGPGPKTALIVGVAVWLGGYVIAILGYLMLGLFPTSMLVMWGGIGLIEILIAALVGGAIYQER